MKVIICVNTAWNLVNFRAGLIRSLIAKGYEVIAVAPSDRYAPHVKGLGCRFIHIGMDSQGTNPAQDVLLLWRIWRLLRRERPDVYLGYTVKPNVYGSLAAHWLGIPVINNIAGLGAVFISEGLLVRLVRCLYRLALAHSVKVFFQNADDRMAFISSGIVHSATADLLPGSGIDLAHFQLTPRISNGAAQSKFRFILIARMLRDKGVREFVEAAKLIRKHLPQVECCLLGFVDVQNPTAISMAEITDWVTQGFVRYLGVSDDVRMQIATADCVVLPSYREGTPRSLLEACAMGRPVITTDVPGCRNVVVDGYNGYLCNVRDAKDLTDKMEKMVSLSAIERIQMGQRGRNKMESEFDEQMVVSKYLSALEQIGVK